MNTLSQPKERATRCAAFVIVGSALVYAFVAPWTFVGVRRILAPLALQAATQPPNWFPNVAGFQWWLFWIAELVTPMLIAMTGWIALGTGRTWPARVLLLALSIPYGLAVGILMRPYVVRGGLEAVGLVPPLTIRHLSGIHDPTGPRQLVWFLWSPLLGAAVALAQSVRSDGAPRWVSWLLSRAVVHRRGGLTRA